MTEEHKSRTCVILRGSVTTSVATTKGRLVEGDQVVVKLMKDPVQFKREITNRKGLSEDSVVMIQASSEDEQLRNRWVDDSRKRGYGEYPCGIVMKAAQRNLMVILVCSKIYQCSLFTVLMCSSTYSIVDCLLHLHISGVWWRD